MLNREEIKAKIVKLLALGSSSHRAEAEAAIAKAHSLMLAYAIQEHELRSTTSSSKYGQKLIRQGKTRSIQHKLICSIIQDFFNVKVISYRMKHEASVTYAFGTESNCEFASYAHDFLLTTFDQLWQQARDAGVFGKEHARSFYFGLSDGFRSTLERDVELFTETSKQSNALIVIEKDLNRSFKKQYPEMKKKVIKFKTDRKKLFRQSIYNKGFREGKKIKVNRALPEVVCG